MTAPAIDDIGVDYPKSGLLRPITEEEKTAYWRDGVAIVRQALAQDWIDYMREAVERIMNRNDTGAQNYAADGKPRFFAQTFPWMYDEAFRAWAIRGPLVEVASQVLEDPEVIFFYDQIFAKEPGDSTETPWHQDQPFLPLKGNQGVRIWVPFDPVDADSGAIHYLLGSNRWGVTYHPIGFKNIPEITDSYMESPFTDQPDFEATYNDYEWLVAEAEPGDLLLHHPLTVHGSRANMKQQYRRAATLFYVGSSTTWDPHPANMFNNKSLTGHMAPPDLIAGGTLECDLFPRVWPR